MDKLVTALAPVFAVGFAVQQLLEILGSFVDAWEPFQKYKKVILGIVSLAIGIGFAWGVEGLRVLQPLFTDYSTGKTTATIAPFLDKFVTALVISAGTEGVNSILKFLKYTKEDKKNEAAKKIGATPAANVPAGAHALPTQQALLSINRK